MSKSNDKTILALKKQIAERKAAVKLGEKFFPLSNCMLELNGTRYNLNTLKKEEIVHFLSILSAAAQVATEMKIIDDYHISGYHISIWITDLKAKLANLSRQAEMEKLKQLELRLHNLLSVDKKVELEIDEIKQQIG